MGKTANRTHEWLCRVFPYRTMRVSLIDNRPQFWSTHEVARSTEFNAKCRRVFVVLGRTNKWLPDVHLRYFVCLRCFPRNEYPSSGRRVLVPRRALTCETDMGATQRVFLRRSTLEAGMRE